MPKNAHINDQGLFQSDKYPSCPAGKVPLSCADPMAQDLLAEYARRRRAVDAEFADGLEIALRSNGFDPLDPRNAWTAWTQVEFDASMVAHAALAKCASQLASIGHPEAINVLAAQDTLSELVRRRGGPR